MTRRRWIADRVEGDYAYLLGPNAAHLFRVLRVKPGQQFHVAAAGQLRLGTVASASEHEVAFHLGQAIEGVALPQINVCVALFKFDRLEWSLEKLTELGVSRVMPVIAQRSAHHLVQAAGGRLLRWRKIVHEAAQQARRLAPPEIENPASLEQILTVVQGSRILLSENETGPMLKTALEDSPPPLTLAFGPEGGWTIEETDLFHGAGWKSASLGPTILRAETAVIAAVAVAFALLPHQPQPSSEQHE